MNYAVGYLLFLNLGSGLCAQDTLRISADISPYFLLSDLYIEQAGMLIIEPGSEIRLGSEVNIISSGSIFICGNEEEPVRLISEDPLKPWGQILTLPGASSVHIKHAIISGGTFRFSECDVRLAHLILKYDENSDWTEPLASISGGNLNVIYTQVTGKNRGEGFICYEVEAPVFRHCTFDAVPDAVEFITCTNGNINNCLFSGMTDDAIDLNACRSILVDSNFIHDVRDRGMEIGSEQFGRSEDIIISRNILANCNEGVVFKEGSTGTAEHNTFYNNGLALGSFQLSDTLPGSNISIRNCIFERNLEHLEVDAASSAAISYCAAGDELFPGEGNSILNPQFIYPEEMNFNLFQTSPCIDAGDPASPPDPDGSPADLGAFHFVPLDLDQITLWPNPTTGRVNIYSPGESEISDVQVFDSGGERIHGEGGNRSSGVQLNLNEKGPGIYVVRFGRNGKLFSLKVKKY